MMATSNQTEDDDEAKIQETRGETTPSCSFFQVMNTYGREFCFILAVVFTAFAALQNGPLKSRKANPPEIFFSTPSLVTDFYQGNFNALVSLLLEKDVSLVMYYAPWDSTCIRAKEEFEAAAKFYHKEVYFAAVNCWWPEGECYRKFKLLSYPIILAHIHDVGGIKYEGPLIANYIISFLDYILTPLTPLQHSGELLDLQTKHEGVVVAFFDFQDASQPTGYVQYYTASLKALSLDPNRRLCFAVITSKKVALKFRMTSSSMIQIHLWNATEVYDEQTVNTENVLKWAYSKLNQVTQWITPPGTKSKLLSEVIEKSPTLIMFTPRNLMLESSPYYDLFREVALDYYNCNVSSHITSLVHRLVLKRHILQEEFAKLLERCRVNSITSTDNLCDQTEESCDLTCCQAVYVDLGFHHASQCVCRACLHHSTDSVVKTKLSECEKTLDLVLKSFEMSKLKSYRHCNEVEVSYPIKFGSFNRLSFKCHTELSKMHLRTGIKDEIDPEDAFEVKDDHVLTMVKNLGKIQCNRLKFALNYTEFNFPAFPLPGNNSWRSNFTGLGCHTNRTLMFIAMDTVQFHTFAESLGVDVFKEFHQTAVIIVEAKQESQYLLNGHLNKRMLVEFIKNYTSGSLDRFLRMPVRNLAQCSAQGKESICVKEITTATFWDVVLENKNDVILMYYATWCGSCSAVAHVYLNVANYFSNIGEITFARISGEDNDLPWEYTAERYPSIIFFPGNRKSDSIEFPPHLPITTTNLLHFILVHAQPKVRWVIAMQLCNSHCVAHNLIRSAAEIRRLFREFYMLRNQLHFVHQILDSPKDKKMESLKHSKTLFRQDSTVLKKESVGEYIKHLLSRVRQKQRKIVQAVQLQDILRRKRDLYFKEKEALQRNKNVGGSSVNKKYNAGMFSKVPPKELKSTVNILKRKNKDEL